MINVLIKWLVIVFISALLLRLIWRVCRTARGARWQEFRRRFGRLCLCYLLLTLAIFFGERLLIYCPLNCALYWLPPDDPAIEDVWFTSVGGHRIHGWWCPIVEPRWVVLYCHGSSSNLSMHQGATARKRWHELGASVLLFDYPGFGHSEGWPSESGCYAAAHAAYAWLVKEKHVSADQLIVCGRSLGTAMAVELAVTHPHKAVILHSPFTSIPDVAQHLFPLFPARWLTHTQFDNFARLQQYRGPLFIAHGDVDELVPYAEGKRLYNASPSMHKQFYRIAGHGHNGVMSRDIYSVIEEFLIQLPAPVATKSYDSW